MLNIGRGNKSLIGSNKILCKSMQVVQSFDGLFGGPKSKDYSFVIDMYLAYYSTSPGYCYHNHCFFDYSEKPDDKLMER